MGDYYQSDHPPESPDDDYDGVYDDWPVCGDDVFEAEWDPMDPDCDVEPQDRPAEFWSVDPEPDDAYRSTQQAQNSQARTATSTPSTQATGCLLLIAILPIAWLVC